jgi:hypothetical protein
MKTKEEIEQFLKKEHELILTTKLISESALKEFFTIDSLAGTYDAHAQKRMLDLINRIYDNELDYLFTAPYDYYAIYNEEEL